LTPILLSALPFLLSISPSLAQGGQTCNSTSLCPSVAPCCSEFGFCGTDNFCLGGCNPLASHTITSCRPEPICEDASFTFNDTSRILSNVTLYDGNATSHDWTLDKGNIQVSNGALAMILTESNGGTRLSSTRYVHYGTISAKIKTGRWAGVVTAFITMSDSKDEIDYEWPGSKTTEVQSNFFWLGVANYTATNGVTSGNLTDTFANYHTYTIDWQPDALTWSVDGNVIRTITKDSTKNAATGTMEYPTTPARVQLSLWPAGIAASAQGTIDWSGGMINWSDPDYLAAGHFYAFVDSVSIKCSTALAVAPDSTSYVYGANDTSGIPTILATNQTTTLNGAGSLKAATWSMLGAAAGTVWFML